MKFILYGYAVSLMPGELGDCLTRFGDFATFLAKNGYFRYFKPRVCKTNRKQDTAEYSRTYGEIVNLVHRAPL